MSSTHIDNAGKVIINQLPGNTGTGYIPSMDASHQAFAQHGKIFIVYGHDGSAVNELQLYLQNTLGYPKPIILPDEAGMGRTIIESFEEKAAQSSLVFVLMTPDDPQPDGKFRARQNVVFELGYFFGRLGRLSGRTIILLKGDIEIPSDIGSVRYIRFDNGIRAAGEDIRQAIDAVLENN